MAKIAVNIVTPERELLNEEADFIALPGSEGEFGVLPGHTHLLAQLAPGEIRIRNGENTEFFAISGGFAEVHPARAHVFAETAEMAKEIDVERARLAAERAKKELTHAATAEEMAQAQAALRRALIRLHVSEGLSKRRAPVK